MFNASVAGKRYVRRFVPTMTAYVVALLAANGAMRTWHPQGALLVLLSLLPALPITGVIVVMGLYILEETDEYQRHRLVTAMVGGIGLMLAIATAWGFLEESEVVPHVPAYWAFPVWCGAMGLVQCLFGLRDWLAGSGE